MKLTLPRDEQYLITDRITVAIVTCSRLGQVAGFVFLLKIKFCDQADALNRPHERVIFRYLR